MKRPIRFDEESFEKIVCPKCGSKHVRIYPDDNHTSIFWGKNGKVLNKKELTHVKSWIIICKECGTISTLNKYFIKRGGKE